MGTIDVILVDDNPTFHRVVKRFIETKSNFRLIAWAENGNDAIDLARRLSPEMVLLDLGMPDVSGLELLPILRSLLPEAAILVVTLLEADSYRQAASQAGADGFVPKARLNSELLPAMESAQEKKGITGESLIQT